MASFTVLVVFLGLCGLVYSQGERYCYDCDPSNNKEKCVTPKENALQVSKCSQENSKVIKGLKKDINDIQNTDELPRAGVNTTLSYECYAFYFSSNNTAVAPSGVYRGCALKTYDIVDTCEFLSQELAGGKVERCSACASDGCNNPHVGGASSVTISMAVLLVSFLLCSYVL